MPWKFNPFTGNLDLVNTSSGTPGSSLTRGQVIDSILVSRDDTVDPPTVEIAFDLDSVLYTDDEEL